MKGWFLVLLICLSSPLLAQHPDTTLYWADRLLLDEVPFPVVNRLARNNFGNKTQLATLNRLTDAALVSLDFSRAATLLHLCDSLASKGNSQELAYLEMNWARYQYELSNYPSSIAHGVTALKQLESLKIKSRILDWIAFRTRLQIGKSQLQMRKLKDAKPYLDAAVQFFGKDSLSYSIQLAQSCYALGLWSKSSGAWEPAIHYYLRAIYLFETSEHERYFDLGKCYNNLATAYQELGEYGKAKPAYLKALQYKNKQVGDTLSLAITYNNVGNFYSRNGNNYQARLNYEKSLSLLDEKSRRHREKLPELLNNYGNLLVNLDEQEAAERYFRKSLQLLQEDNARRDKQLAPLLSLAGVLMNRNDFKGAEVVLDKAQQVLADSLSTRQLLATWHWQMANLRSFQNDTDQAERHFVRALSVLYPARTLLTSDINLLLGGLKLKKKDNHSAMTAFKTSRDIVGENLGVSHPQLCGPFNMMAATFLNMGDLDSAIYYFQKAIDNNLVVRTADHATGLEAVYPIELISSFYYMSMSFQRRYGFTADVRDLEKSASYADLGLHAIDARRKSLSMTNDQLVFDEQVAVFFEQAMETYFLLEEKKPNPANLEKLFGISELAKSQALGQSLRQSNLRTFSNVSATLQREEETLREKIQTIDLQSLKEVKSGPDANPDRVREYQMELGKANERYQNLQDSIRQNLPGYYQLKYNKTLITLSDVQHDILATEPGTALIQFTVGDSSVYVHVITKERQQVYRAEHANEIKGRIIAFRNQIKLGLKTELYENAAWLYQHLLARAEGIFHNSDTRVEKLIIIPDQILCYLPFEALMKSATANRFLIHDWDISYAYSATLLWQKFKERSAIVHAGFVGLAPEFGVLDRHIIGATRDEAGETAESFHFQPLAGNLTEVNAISVGMEKRRVHSNVLEGRQATEASFRKLNLKEYDYVHFATHSFVDMDNPQRSGVAFSKNEEAKTFDDILFTNEVYEMQFNARLVCLSSCDSGIGKLYKGEGMIGLAQAFLYAGARNLVVSLWKVDDEATSELMINFYSHLPNQSLSNALSSAKRKMAGSKKFSHPYYWSSFILIGM